MAKQFEYTTLAHRYTARFPVLTYVGTQTNFWVAANLLLTIVIYLYSLVITEAFGIPAPAPFSTLLLIAVILGVSYGVSLGFAGYYLDKTFFRRLSLGKVMVLKSMISFSLLAVVLSLLRLILFDLLLAPSLDLSRVTLSDRSWDYLFSLLLIYYFFMTLVISFVNQVNRKYGPGVLLPLLLGQYRDPKEEERIFLFMDLKSSTSTAEKLGHLRYSSFIRDCFADINEVLFPYRAQVYQYVGDEIVVMWPVGEGLRDHACIAFYFACKNQFETRSEYYDTHYGCIPLFKAGLHMGTVTAVEIGEIKRDIAYHGDTLNTAARIQSMCNDFNKNLLVSEYLIHRIGPDPRMTTEHLGMILLRGKTAKVGVVSCEWSLPLR